MSGSAKGTDVVDESSPLNPPRSPVTYAVVDVEEVPLDMVPGQGNEREPDACGEGPALTYCCHDQYYRTLAIGSIVCGFSCIGCKALIYSVKAETATDPETVRTFSLRARKLSVISIVSWLIFLVSIPILMCLISYFLTFFD